MSAAVRTNKLSPTAVKDANNIRAWFSSERAKILLQGEEYLGGPLKLVTHSFGEVLHHSMASVVNEDQCLLLVAVPLGRGEAISILADFF